MNIKATFQKICARRKKQIKKKACVQNDRQEILNTLMENYIKNDEKLTEKNKEINPIEWTKLMNNYKNMAEEIVLKEYIFI